MLRRLGGILALLLLSVLPLVVPVRADDLDDQPVAPAPAELGPAGPAPAGPALDPTMPVAGAPVRNNIFGLNVARLMQERYIWAASDLVNANGGDWGYITVVWTADDRDDPRADLNLQVFLERCYYFHVQPIIRVATRFNPRSEDWARPTPDEPAKWRAFFERATWPTRRVWVIVGNEPNLGREWGGFVDAGDYARYLDRFLDVFEGSDRFKVVNAPLDASNATELPKMQDAYEFLAEMQAAVPDVFERLGAWASNPYRVISGGDALRYTHRAYEAELEAIGRDLPVLIAEAGHLETGDEQEIARFYREAFVDWMADPRVVAVTPLFWHPDRGEYWMFELDRRGAMIYRSPTYEMLRTLPRVAGSPHYAPTLANVPRPPRPTVAEDEATDGAAMQDGRTESGPAFGPNARADQASTIPQSAAGPSDAAAVDDPEAAVVGQAAGTPSGTMAGDRTARQSGDRVTGASRGTASSGATSGGRPASGGSSVDTAASSTASSSTVSSGAAPTRMLQVVGTGALGAQVRSGPNLGASPVTLVDDGAQLVARGPAEVVDGRAWQPVRTADGLDGWIAAELVAPVAERPDPAPLDTTPAQRSATPAPPTAPTVAPEPSAAGSTTTPAPGPGPSTPAEPDEDPVE